MTTEIKDVFGRPLKDLRISVTDRCNFRCPYCMPAEIYGDSYHFLPKAELLTFEEIERLTRIFVGMGVTKVRLTGGEPLIRNEMEKLVGMLSRIEGVQDLTLTTNGFLLSQKAQALKEAGLQRVTVSLDSLDDVVFGRMNGRGYGTKRVLDGIQRAAEVGLQPIKINVVVQRGVNDHTIVDLARFFKDLGHIVRFIEYRGEVALRYKYQEGTGEIGIIASVSQPFCGDCTRMRLTTDGKLITCLFATEGTDLRSPLRDGASDDDLTALIASVWSVRTDRYSEERALLTEKRSNKVEMYQIGG